ncbi:alpha/beta hydrolase [Rhizobium herbae]|uniref:Acetyl esterase n=1 Tax=Rhizobium herbae TaxID=508661 RepID=A0ABS4EQ01_9HYPH|nr:alpha/beta hydrolase [Rhizobium herbae]MBP1860020.1 acetyl esterase [Rhizobium herbae]
MTVPLDPGAQRVLDLGRAAAGVPFEAGTPDEARAAYDAGCPTLQGDKEPVSVIKDIGIAGPEAPIALRIYRGKGAPVSGAPALLYLHGGGWVIGNLESHDEICRWFANLAGCVVVCPDYRLAPEHRFPAGLQDCAATLVHMACAAVELGIDAARIAVAGDSAGGNLAAVLALMARNGDVPPLSAQLLIYPNTDAAQSADSYRRFSEGYGLSTSTMKWFRNHYIRSEADIADWRVSPLTVDRLDGVAPAFVVTAGYDILADEGLAYAERLALTRVPLVRRHRPDQIHGFVSMGRHIPAALETVQEAVAAWRSFDPA